MSFSRINRSSGRQAKKAVTTESLANPAQWRGKFEHYNNLVESVGANDPVTRESHRQHAEHFFRLMQEHNERPPVREFPPV